MKVKAEEIDAILAKYRPAVLEPGDITLVQAAKKLGVGVTKAKLIMDAAPEFVALLVRLPSGKMAWVWRLKKRGKINKTKE